MESIHKFTVLKNHNLVIQYHQNKLTVPGMKQLKMKMLNDPDIHALDDYDTIVDIRLCSIDCTFYQLQNYRKFISSCYKTDANKRVAILTDDPKQVALATIFTLAPANDNIQYKIFSSLQGVLKWLNRPPTQEEEIDEAICQQQERSSRKEIIKSHLKARFQPVVNYI